MRPRALAVALLAAAAATLLPTSGAAAAGVEVQHAAAFPMAPRESTVAPGEIDQGIGSNLVCTADPRNRIYGNDPYDQSQPWDFQKNNPSVDDIVRAPQAGASSDLCIGLALTPNVEPNVIGADYAADHAWRVQPTTNPFPDEPDTHVWDNAKEEPVVGDDLRDAVIDLPAGFAAAPAAVGTCSDAAFGVGNFLDPTCPAATQVGDATFRLSLGFGQLVFFGPMAIGKIYNLPAGPNEVARLGAVASPDPIIDGGAPVKFLIRVTLAPGTGRLRAIVQDAPRELHTDDQMDAQGQFISQDAANTSLPLYIEGIGIRIWGSKAAHPTLPADFGETGSECSASSRADVSITTYKGVRSAVASPDFTPTGCERLAFDPSVQMAVAERRAGVPTAVQVKLGFGQETGNGLRAATLKDATVTLPPGLELGAQVGSGDGGLPLCRAGQFGRGAEGPNGCPAASRVGDVTIASPLIGPELTGGVYLGEQGAVGELPALYVEAGLAGATAVDAPRIKLVGSVVADDAGRITATFADNPQLRFSELDLRFRGGAHALFSTPRTCGRHGTTSQLRAHARGSADAVPSAITVDEGCEAPTFAPTAAVDIASPQAGASSRTTIRIARPDGAPWLQSVDVALPAGLLADLNVATECAPDQLATAACPSSSRVGTVRVTSGTGPSPLPLDGALYLTGREPGSVAGVAIIVRARIGELDLGDVVVPGRIDLRPTDAGLTFRATVPTRFRGLALALQTVDVALDRPGFALSPTACGPLPFAARIVGDGGQVAAPSGQVGLTGCSQLPFAPALDAKLTGDVTPGGHPGMHVEVRSRAGDTNLASASVVLPEGVVAELPNLQVSCDQATFRAQACPAATKIGTATAVVSIASEAIPGDIVLLKVPGESLPGLGLSFTGRFTQRVSSVVKVGQDGRLLVRFDAIPDLPLRRLVLDVRGGAKGPLRLAPGDCANGTRWDGTFRGQGGQTAKAQTGLRCAARAAVRLSGRTGLSVRLFDLGGRTLQSATVTLPAGYGFVPGRATRKGAMWVRLAGGQARVRITPKVLTARVTTKTATTLRIKVGGRAVKAPRPPRSNKPKKVPVRLRLAFTDGAVQHQTISVSPEQ